MMSSSTSRTDPIRAVTFDVGGTLIEATPSVGSIYASVCRAHGVEVRAEACDRLFETAWYGRGAALPPGCDRFSSTPGGEDGWWRSVVLEVLEGCGVPRPLAPPIEAFRSAFASPSAWRVFDDVPSTMEVLRRRGCRLGVVSNWDSRLPGLLDRLGLAVHFDSVVCSAIERVEKPHPRIFERVVEELGVPAAEILHVGDDIRADYQGATAAGMSALWIDRGGGVPSGVPAVHADRIVTSIAQVVGRLNGAGGPPDRARKG